MRVYSYLFHFPRISPGFFTFPMTEKAKEGGKGTEPEIRYVSGGGGDPGTPQHPGIPGQIFDNKESDTQPPRILLPLFGQILHWRIWFTKIPYSNLFFFTRCGVFLKLLWPFVYCILRPIKLHFFNFLQINVK